MTHRFTRARNAGAGCLPFVLAAGALGCAAEPDPAPPPRGTVVGSLVARIEPRRHAITITSAASAEPGLAPQSIDTLPVVQDGTPGSGPTSTVELVTSSVGDTFAGDTCPGVAPGTKAFCGNVTLNQFYPRPIGNVFVQVTSIADGNFRPLAGHQALNSDPAALGLDPSLGLWRYTAPNATTPGVLGDAPDNGAARDWVFANPDDADTNVALRVIASLTYASYTRTASGLSFVDACAGGGMPLTGPTNLIDLPFAFTMYDTTETMVTAHRRGVLSLGATGLIAPAKNVQLPASGNVPSCTSFTQCTVPRPAIFPFWDNLLYLGGGGICTQASGTAPNRTFAVTWSHVGRTGSLADSTSDYSFTVVLHEGTDVIDLLYGQMTGPLPNAAGGSAVVGIQNAAGTVATADFHKANYGTGASWTFKPVP